MASFGETLKRERELRDISLRQISEATKISIRYLEALEGNRFEALPGGLFNKGFIRAYAAYVGLDSESMVNSYLHEIGSSATFPDAGTGRTPPALHRPVEAPQRRAVPRSEAGGLAGSMPPFAAADVTRHAEDPGLDRASAPRAISAIETIDRTAASSRALLWIFSLVAGAGVVFLILTLATGRSPKLAEAPASSPAPVTEAPSGSNPAGAIATEAAVSDEPPPRNESRDTAAPAIASLGGHRSETTKAPDAPKAPHTGMASIEQEEPSRPDDQGGAVPMELQVQIAFSSWVQLSCDAERVVDGMMRAGETFTTQCLNLIRVSATDAGAVSLSINGAPCLPLGEPGTRAYGYTIRSDDFRQICPPAGRGADGRP